MPTSAEIPAVNFTSAREMITIALQADTPVLLMGDPGVGKSALMRLAADAVGLPLVTLLGSTIDPTDVGGIPFMVEGQVKRFPLAAIRRACDEPVLLFLDEISCAPPVVQAALLRLILERVAGDSQLHAGTRVVGAANPPEQAPGGFELSAPLIGRVAIVKLRPTNLEVLGFFSTLGAEGSHLRAHAEDFALTAGVQPDLLQIDIPPDAVAGNSPWGAPRSWERAIRARAQADALGISLEADAVAALTEGSVGRTAAIAFTAILKLRKDLPSVEEIVANPESAKIPEDHKKQIAVLGVIGHVAKENTWAAWIYAERLPRAEYKAACAKLLQKRIPAALNAAHAKEGVAARVRLLAALPRLSA